MENKDANTDYQKVVGRPKVRNCRNHNRYHFFCLRFVFTIFYRFVFTIFYTESFQVPPEKIPPHQKANSHPKSQFDLSPI